MLYVTRKIDRKNHPNQIGIEPASSNDRVAALPVKASPSQIQYIL